MSMMQAGQTEITIFARLLDHDGDRLSEELARYILELGFNEEDKVRMHDLAIRNQADALSPADREELLAFGKAGDLLSILKSRARRALGLKSKSGIDLRG